MPHYVDNKKLHQDLTDYKRRCAEAEANRAEPPVIPDEIAQAMICIAEGLAQKPNFRFYSFADEMVGDAILDMTSYVRNYNPDKYSNPFAYLSQIAYFSFVHRLRREARHQYLKYAQLLDALVDEELSGEAGQDIGTTAATFVTAYETAMDAEREKRRRTRRRTPKTARARHVDK